MRLHAWDRFGRIRYAADFRFERLHRDPGANCDNPFVRRAHTGGKPRPTVTVAIPTYNGTAFLAPAIESVLAQTLPNFELLIVDDHSSDDIDSVLALFDDPRIRVLRNDRNLGPEANWNRCLTEARGRYFKLLPQDGQRLLPIACARKLRFLKPIAMSALH
jgi:cellulose synthase/poly-beta-1,6-N-acetylglucosamine synthase-like glycosyltransferase